jgi:soluble lytic murein transglycosylase-like protein
MDILTEISAVQNRIAEITGVAQNADEASVAPAFNNALASAMGSAPAAQTSPFAAFASPAVAPALVPPQQIDSLVAQNSATWQVDPSLVKAIIANESGFDANATSKVGAQGLMQLMPSTAQSVGVRNAYDPAQNVAGGTRYLKGLLDRFNGDVRLAVAAYNAGPEAVAKYGDVPPYAETQTYVQKVLSSLSAYQQQRTAGAAVATVAAPPSEQVDAAVLAP